MGTITLHVSLVPDLAPQGPGELLTGFSYMTM